MRAPPAGAQRRDVDDRLPLDHHFITPKCSAAQSLAREVCPGARFRRRRTRRRQGAISAGYEASEGVLAGAAQSARWNALSGR